MEENQSQQPQPFTSKQRFLDAVGKEVPLDYFLFTALEHERLLRALKAHPDHDIRWQGMATDDSVGFEAAFAKMLTWYKTEYPELNDSGVLDAEKAVVAIPKLTGINRDIQALHQAKAGSDLPAYDKSAPVAVWGELERVLNAAFPSFGHLFLRYLQWAHGTEIVETFEPGSRPPVGRYAPPMLRTGTDRFGRGRSGPGGAGGRSGPHGRSSSSGDRGPRPEREPRDGAAHNDGDDRAAGEASTRESRSPRPDRGPRNNDRGPRSDRGPRRDAGGDRGPRRRPNDDETNRLTDVALAEVERAIEMLRSDNSVPDVTLKPTNSYYRRIQHQKAIDMGFTSNSIGEGNDRAVKVARKE